jgi:hypothetical protein
MSEGRQRSEAYRELDRVVGFLMTVAIGAFMVYTIVTWLAAAVGWGLSFV